MAQAQVRLERIYKGVANHRRIEMLQVLDREPDLSLTELMERVGVDMRTASEHLRKLALAGLIWKNKVGRQVRHRVSDRGQAVLRFTQTL